MRKNRRGKVQPRSYSMSLRARVLPERRAQENRSGRSQVFAPATGVEYGMLIMVITAANPIGTK